MRCAAEFGDAVWVRGWAAGEEAGWDGDVDC